MDETFHLTPLDVRRYDFGKSLRGYNPERVEQFREQVAQELDRLTRVSLDLEQKAKGFQVEERKTVQKGVYQKPRPPVARPGTPNSVFALGQVWPGRA